MANMMGPPLLRPFNPNERRPNPDGSYSTEITTTWQLPDGQWANVPSLWMGPQGPVEFNPDDEDSIMTSMRNLEQINGPSFQRFPSVQAAEAAAQARSQAGGAGANRGTTIADIRAQFPQYQDLSDQQLADAMHRKFYADMPRDEFNAKIGLKQPNGHSAPEYVPPGVENYNPETGMVEKQYGKAGSAAMGAADATTFGFGDELASTLAAGIEALPGRSGMSRSQILAQMRGNAEDAQTQNPGSYLAGQVGGGVAQALATGGGGFAANAARTGGGLGRVALGSGLDGAAYLGLQGAGSGTDLESRAKEAGWGAVTGFGTGLAAPIIMAGGSKVVQKVLSPFTAPSELTNATKVLASEGVPLTAGQQTGSKALRYAESEIGGQAAADIIDKQGRAFTDAAMRKAGGSGLADPENLAALKGKLGKGFEYLSSRNSLKIDQGLVDDMNRARNEYARVLPSDKKAIFQSLGDDIIERFRAGKNAMSGKDYQTIRSRLSRMSKNYRNSDNEFSDAIRGLRDALDNGMERSILPSDKNAWSALRRRYGNYKVLEKAANGGGEDAGIGIISPARLRMAASSGNQSGFVTGRSDFTKLAKAGQAAMTPLPNSGTPSRLAARNLGAMAPSLLGASAGGVYGAQDGGGLQGAITGAFAGFIAPRAVGKLMMSKPGQRYLANQLMRSGAMTAEKRALINAILTYSGSAATSRLAP